MNERVKVVREKKTKQILFSCIEQFIKTGKPVGSNALKESVFEALSSATIRNYYADLEEEGYLCQLHTSGGRIPTEKAYRWYIETLDQEQIRMSSQPSAEMKEILNRDAVDLSSYFLEAIGWLSSELKAPVFLSSPRFDHDIVKAIRLIVLNSNKCLFILHTQFGQVHTEILPLNGKLTRHSERRIEQYFIWRLRGAPEEERPQDSEDLVSAEHFYQELMLRYIVRYTHFAHEEIIRSGFSHLLYAEDLKESAVLANTLSLFEAPRALRLLLREAVKRPTLSSWIGKELEVFHEGAKEATLVALPYKIGPKIVGAVALLGQNRSPFDHWIETLYPFVDLLSKNLTVNLYQHNITYREAKEGPSFLPDHERVWLLQHRAPILLENKSEE